MNLYEISDALVNAVQIDPETGEITNTEEVEALQMELDAKIENLALWIKNLKADAEALKAEKDRLAERQRVTENKVKSLSNYLASFLNGRKFETARVAISYRKSTSVEAEDWVLDDALRNNPQYVRAKFELDKTSLKDALKAGLEIPGVTLIEKSNMVIK